MDPCTAVVVPFIVVVNPCTVIVVSAATSIIIPDILVLDVPDNFASAPLIETLVLPVIVTSGACALSHCESWAETVHPFKG